MCLTLPATQNIRVKPECGKENAPLRIHPQDEIVMPWDIRVAEGVTWLQVAELSERPHLQVIQLEGVGLSASQRPHHLLIDHAHAAELHQRPE